MIELKDEGRKFTHLVIIDESDELKKYNDLLGEEFKEDERTKYHLLDKGGELQKLLDELKKEAQDRKQEKTRPLPPIPTKEDQEAAEYDTKFRQKLERRDDKVNEEIKKIERNIEILEKEKARHEQELANKPEKVDIDQKIKEERKKIKEKEVNARDLAKGKEKKYRKADRQEEDDLQLKLKSITESLAGTKSHKEIAKDDELKKKLSDVQSRRIIRFIAYLDRKIARLKKNENNRSFPLEAPPEVNKKSSTAIKFKAYAQIILNAKINGNLLIDESGVIYSTDNVLNSEPFDLQLSIIK